MLWVFLLRLVVKKISVRNHNEQIVSSLINLHNFLPTTRAHPIFDRLQNTMQQQINETFGIPQSASRTRTNLLSTRWTT